MSSDANTAANGGIEADDIQLYDGIPIRNLWLLLFYASDLFTEVGPDRVRKDAPPDDIPNLVAELLTRTVEQRLRRNLSFGYQTVDKTLHRVRGRIDFLKSRRHQLEKQGKIACRFDEFTVNTPRNRFVRAALDKLIPMLSNAGLAHRCRTLSLTLQRIGVTGAMPQLSEISSIRFGRHDKEDQRMLTAAMLVFQLAIPTEQVGPHLFSRLSRDSHWLRRLFEKAVGGFYHAVLPSPGWRVLRGKGLKWPVDLKSERIDEILPSMITDIIIENRRTGHRTIIDTKFTAILKPGRKDDQMKLRSGYIYQIYAYLRSQENLDDPMSMKTSGLLLHPSIDGDVDESVTIQGHRIRFATVDLSASATSIRDRLLLFAN